MQMVEVSVHARHLLASSFLQQLLRTRVAFGSCHSSWRLEPVIDAVQGRPVFPLQQHLHNEDENFGIQMYEGMLESARPSEKDGRMGRMGGAGAGANDWWYPEEARHPVWQILGKGKAGLYRS